MISIFKNSALLIAIVALAGCGSGDLAPIPAHGDPYTAQHVVFSGQDDLAAHIAFGTIVRTFDSSGILHITVPVRNTTPSDIYVDYRVTYFDENHNPVDVPTAWKTQTLSSDIFQNIQDNSSTPRAKDFQVDFRPAQ
jgi:uncharacterized protein YcfL